MLIDCLKNSSSRTYSRHKDGITLSTREGTERETLYYAHDLRKNVVSLFDAKGLRRASYQYDPYGNITSIEGDMAENNPFRFSSEHHDEDLGLVYYNYRHYNPTDGRWTSRDPIAEQGGWNLYAFVGNNPISTIDRLGCLPDQDDINAYCDKLDRWAKRLEAMYQESGNKITCELQEEYNKYLAFSVFLNNKVSEFIDDQWYLSSSDHETINRTFNVKLALCNWNLRPDSDQCAAQLHSGENVTSSIHNTPLKRNEEWIRNTANFSIGFGDSTTLHLTRVIREYFWGRDCISDSESTYRYTGEIAAMVFYIQGSVRQFFRPTTKPGYMLVSSWGREGYRAMHSGMWVVAGTASWVNYICTFKWESSAWLRWGKLVGNRKAAFKTGQCYEVLKSSVKWPRGWEWFNEFL